MCFRRHGRREGKVGMCIGEAAQTCLFQGVKRCFVFFAWQAWQIVTFDVSWEECLFTTVVAVKYEVALSIVEATKSCLFPGGKRSCHVVRSEGFSFLVLNPSSKTGPQ